MWSQGPTNPLSKLYETQNGNTIINDNGAGNEILQVYPLLAVVDVKNFVMIWDVSQPLLPVLIAKLQLGNSVDVEIVTKFNFLVERNEGELETSIVVSKNKYGDMKWVKAEELSKMSSDNTSIVSGDSSDSKEYEIYVKSYKITRMGDKWNIAIDEQNSNVIKTKSPLPSHLTSRRDRLKQSSNFALSGDDDKLRVKFVKVQQEEEDVIFPRQNSGIFIFLAMFTLVVELTQFLSFPFSINLPFSHRASGNLPSFLKAFQFNFSGMTEIFNGILFGLVVLFVFSYIILIAHYLRAEVDRHDIHFIPSAVLWAGSTVLVIPVVKVLSTGGTCMKDEETNEIVMIAFNSIKCFETNSYWVILILSSLLLFIFIIASVIALPIEGDFALYGEDSIKKRKFHFLSKQSDEFELFLLCFKILLTMLIAYFGYSDEYRLFLILTSTSMAVFTLTLSQSSPSFFEEIGNRLRSVFNFAIVYTNIMGIFLLVYGTNENSSFDITIVYMVMFLPILLLAWISTKEKSALISILRFLSYVFIVLLALVFTFLILFFPYIVMVGCICIDDESKCLFGNSESAVFIVLIGVISGVICCTFCFTKGLNLDYEESDEMANVKMYLINLTFVFFASVLIPIFFGSICVTKGSYCFMDNVGAGYGLIIFGLIIFISNVAAIIISNSYLFETGYYGILSSTSKGMKKWYFCFILVFNLLAIFMLWGAVCAFDHHKMPNNLCPHSEKNSKIWFSVLFVTMIIISTLFCFCVVGFTLPE